MPLQNPCGNSGGSFHAGDTLRLWNPPDGVSTNFSSDAQGNVTASLVTTPDASALVNQPVSYIYASGPATNLSGNVGTGTLVVTTVPPPTITAVVPNRGALDGGTAVTITGTGFKSGLTLMFGDKAAHLDQIQQALITEISIPALTPSQKDPGRVDVKITNPDGQSATLPNGFTYLAAAPRLTALLPTSGPITGGTTVLISGTGLQAGLSVSFGSRPAIVQNLAADGTSISVTTPAVTLARAVDVTVTNADGQAASLPASFTYLPTAAAPTISGVAPRSGPSSGGTQVTITGAGFKAKDVSVSFGGAPAGIIGTPTDTTITVTTPPFTSSALSSAVDVTVTNPDGQFATLAGAFTYVVPSPAPTLSSVTPNTGPTTGGAAVTITGTGFRTGLTVTFGGAAARILVTPTSTTITAATPAVNAAGAVNVTVTNPDQQSVTLPNGYTYTVSAPAPVIRSVLPAFGLIGGGTPVTITGTGFQPGVSVFFGGASASIQGTPISTSISVLAPLSSVPPPFGPTGTVNLTVTNPDGQSTILPNGFSYVAAIFTLKVINTNPGALGAILSNPPGISFCGGTCTANFPTGTSVDLFTEAFSAATWSGCDAVDIAKVHCTVIMNADKSVTVAP